MHGQKNIKSQQVCSKYKRKQLQLHTNACLLHCKATLSEQDIHSTIFRSTGNLPHETTSIQVAPCSACSALQRPCDGLLLRPVSTTCLKRTVPQINFERLRSISYEIGFVFIIYSNSSMLSTLNICTGVGTLIVATIYLQLIQNRYMFRSFTVLHCSHQHCVQPVASDAEVVGYL